jgi:hypothetical protein
MSRRFFIKSLIKEFAAKKRANKACSGFVGIFGIYKLFAKLGFEFFLLSN